MTARRIALVCSVSALTLISPKDAGRRSAFIERMNISGSKARAEAAVDRNANQDRAVARIEFKATGGGWRGGHLAFLGSGSFFRFFLEFPPGEPIAEK